MSSALQTFVGDDHGVLRDGEKSSLQLQVHATTSGLELHVSHGQHSLKGDLQGLYRVLILKGS